MRVVLNSKHREGGSTSDSPLWVLNRPISNVGAYTVRQCVIPNTMYSFTTRDNTLTINGQTLSMPTDQRYTTMEVFIQDFNAAVPSISNVTTLRATMDTERGKLTITYNSSTAVTINAAPRFGLTENITGAASTTGSITFDSIFSLVPLKVVNIRCPRLLSEDYRSTRGFENIIATIPMYGDFGSLSVHQNEGEDFMGLTAGGHIDRLQMQLCDGDGRPISLNGADWFIELEFRQA